jgi:hypothetical protein
MSSLGLTLNTDRTTIRGSLQAETSDYIKVSFARQIASSWRASWCTSWALSRKSGEHPGERNWKSQGNLAGEHTWDRDTRESVDGFLLHSDSWYSVPLRMVSMHSGALIQCDAPSSRIESSTTPLYLGILEK